MIRYLRVCRYQQLSSPYQPRPYLMAALCVPAQWHKVRNPLTCSTFKPGFSPSVCRGVVEPDFQNPSIVSPKVCFMISPGCSFSSGNIRINETAVEVFTGVAKIWSNIIILLKENKKKITLFTGIRWKSTRRELTRFLWGKKKSRDSCFCCFNSQNRFCLQLLWGCGHPSLVNKTLNN